MDALTDTEREHLRLLRLGLTARAAGCVGPRYVSLFTVRRIRRAIKDKIGDNEYAKATKEGDDARMRMMIQAAA